MNTRDNLLNITDLSVFFYTRRGVVKAVEDVNLSIKPENVVGLVGESGSGKSTMAFAIMRLLPPQGRITQGNIIFDGKDIASLDEKEVRQIRGKEIAMVFQDPLSFLNPVMKIGEQIIEAILSREGSRQEDAEERAVQLLERLGIPRSRNIINDYPHQLSGGMRQRILMAIATVSNPSLLIADEPTTALDVTVQAQILDEIKSLAQKINSSVLLITHDLGIVAETCNEVNVMYAGKIVECGNVKNIFDNPLHPYTSALLDSALSIEEFKEKLIGIGGEVPNLINPPKGCRFHPRCPKAMSICHKEEPKPYTTEKDHKTFCWLYKES